VPLGRTDRFEPERLDGGDAISITLRRVRYRSRITTIL
jgi:hypothetical protein